MDRLTRLRTAKRLLLISLCLLIPIVAGCGDADDQRDAALTDTELSDPAAELEIPREDEQVPIDAPPKGDQAVSSSQLDDAIEAIAEDESVPEGVEVEGDQILVEIIVDPGAKGATQDQVAELGGDTEGSAGRTVIQAYVPAESLEELEQSEGVQFVRPPLDANVPLENEGDAVDREAASTEFVGGAKRGEEVAKIGATAWHNAGINGSGVKVGIIDSFDTSWNAAQGSGEVPAPAGTFCRVNFSNCNIYGGGSKHGVAVAEIIHEMAPGATLYLASAQTASDVQAAVNYFAQNGVKIISRSQGSFYDGPGDGTGPMGDVVKSAVAQGMTWFNATGNSGGRTTYGTYNRTNWADADRDGWMEFAPGDEQLGMICGYIMGLRWNDWGPGERTDYDMFITNQSGNVIASSTDVQGYGLTQPPLENAQCGTQGEVVFLWIRLTRQGNGTAGDVLEFQTNQGPLEYSNNHHSAAIPAVDSASPGMIAVGAIDPPTGTKFAEYTSEGPTNDDRIKPDLSAAACVTSLSYQPCFNGTSSATPAAAGAAALVLSANPSFTPPALRNYLLNSTVERGAAGPDNIYGKGELILSAPPNVPQQPPPVTPTEQPPTNPPGGTGGSGSGASGGSSGSGSSGGSGGGGGGGDVEPPDLHAIDSTGKRGGSAKLQYTVRDDSGRSRETIRIISGKGPATTAERKLSEATGGRYTVSVALPKKAKRGNAQFCVVSYDPSGNASDESCAKLKVK